MPIVKPRRDRFDAVRWISGGGLPAFRAAQATEPHGAEKRYGQSTRSTFEHGSSTG
jgi:hypothetical protein